MLKKIFFALLIGLLGIIAYFDLSIAKAAATNTIPNPSLELISSGQPSNWSKDSWGTNSATFSVLNSGHTGIHSIKVVMSNFQSGDAKWFYTPQTVTPNASYNFSNWYQSNVSTEIDLMYLTSSGQENYVYLGSVPASSVWAQTNFTFTMPANAVKASVMQIIFKNGSLTTDDYSLSTGTTPPPPPPSSNFNRPIISLTFDDGYESLYSAGLPLLNKYGFKSTDYIHIVDIANGDYMTLAQIKAMYAAGNEIGSHSVTHPHLPNLSVAKIDKELLNSKTYLQTNVGPVYNFATPYGENSAKVTTELKKYYRSSRSVDSGFNSPSNFNQYNLLVRNILQTTTLAEVQSWIAAAKQNNYWLILVYHQIDQSGDEYGTTPEKLNSHLNAIKQSGLTVLTINKALDEVLPQIK